MVKIPPAKAGNAGLIPGLERFLGVGNGNPFQCAWLFSWTKESGGLQFMGSQRVRS